MSNKFTEHIMMRTVRSLSNPSTTCNAVHAIICSPSHVSNTVTCTWPPAQPPTTRNPNLFKMSNPAKTPLHPPP